jgi:hypothetical protein
MIFSEAFHSRLSLSVTLVHTLTASMCFNIIFPHKSSLSYTDYFPSLFSPIKIVCVFLIVTIRVTSFAHLILVASSNNTVKVEKPGTKVKIFSCPLLSMSMLLLRRSHISPQYKTTDKIKVY